MLLTTWVQSGREALQALQDKGCLFSPKDSFPDRDGTSWPVEDGVGEGHPDFEGLVEIPSAPVSRPPAIRYDVIKVYARSARVSDAPRDLGMVVGPPVVHIIVSENLESGIFGSFDNEMPSSEIEDASHGI